MTDYSLGSTFGKAAPRPQTWAGNLGLGDLPNHRSASDIAFGLHPSDTRPEGVERSAHFARVVDSGNQAARCTHDVDAVRQHRDAKPMTEIGVEHNSTIIAMMPVELIEAAKKIAER